MRIIKTTIFFFLFTDIVEKIESRGFFFVLYYRHAHYRFENNLIHRLTKKVSEFVVAANGHVLKKKFNIIFYFYRKKKKMKK